MIRAIDLERDDIGTPAVVELRDPEPLRLPGRARVILVYEHRLVRLGT